ncbi:putative flagellin [Desulfamplus magnetovallimortis]|uniref:Putative flagellin n=1 Tax=Desulfamplus magnetovallimortis TaxID=1246637 RepID=A0A1W1H9X4_9BACT|nr:flagellar hook-associated protein FlgL [Desulfamplus magnetovallimortis]SLM29215.1 putative flagellin [Desulfamplus magnetovallimortis]
MRVPTISTYATATYRLGTLTEDLKDANEVMSTQKVINSLADDPIGMTQVLDLNENIKHLEQIETNVEMGRTWLSGIESSLDSVSDLILEVKTSVQYLSNASINKDDRKDAIENVNNMIDQILLLGNTRVNGNYIFSGTSTDVAPFEFHSDETPQRVSYEGDDTAFKIRSDKSAEIPVGRVGSEVFWQDEVAINSTNNTIYFMEDPGHGPDYEKMVTAVIPEGQYNRESLQTAIRNELNRASAEDGYGVTYEVKYNEDTKLFSIMEDGSYDGYMATEFLWDTEASITEDAYVDQISAGGTIILDEINTIVHDTDAINTGDEPQEFKLTWAWDEASSQNYWALENGDGVALPASIGAPDPVTGEQVFTYENNGGTIPSKIVGTNDGFDIYFDGNDFADLSITFDSSVQEDDYVKFTVNPEIVTNLSDTSLGHEIGFVDENVISAPHLSDNPVTYDFSPAPVGSGPLLIIDTAPGINNKLDFQEVIGEGDERVVYTLTASVKAKNYNSNEELAKEVEKAMESESLARGNRIDYSVSWDAEMEKFSIKENGTTLQEFNLLWQSGDNAPASEGGTGESIGSILGFDAEDDLKSPMTGNRPAEWGIFNTLIDLKTYLASDDVDGIQRTIGRLDTSYDHTTSVMADTGMKYNRLEMRKTITSEMGLNLTERRSSIEDADIVEAIMNLQSIQSAYEAALGSTSKIMNVSLMDYM